MDPTTGLQIHRESAAAPDSVALIDELTADLAQEGYPDESTHGYSVDQLVTSGVAFFVARVAGRPAGCGGLQVFADPSGRYGELKRMYVRPAHRGTGIAHELFARLVSQAREEGLAVLRLETGSRQAAAIAFYRRVGFVEAAPFGPYRLDPESVYMEWRLQGSVHDS